MRQVKHAARNLGLSYNKKSPKKLRLEAGLVLTNSISAGIPTQKWDAKAARKGGTQKWDAKVGRKSGTQKSDTK